MRFNKGLFLVFITAFIVFGIISFKISTPQVGNLEESPTEYQVQLPFKETDPDIVSLGNTSFKGIYVNQVYRVDDNQIRFVYLEHRDNKVSLEAQIGSSIFPVRYFCFNVTCNDYLFCDMATRIGVIQIPAKTKEINYLHIGAKGNQEMFRIDVKDVRPPTDLSYKHSVGVCLQPIFFYTDWPLVVQFFESWIAQGATKFYFYVHSYSKQTKRVIDFYKTKLGDQLELIPWSDLPTHKRHRGSFYDDPNAHVFRHAATAFMHDCLLRARYEVKYIGNFDMDDFPFAADLDLPGTLDGLFASEPDAAQMFVSWKLSKQSLDWDSINTPSEVDLSLSDVHLIAPEQVRADYIASTKMYLRPERVVHFDMHNVYENEFIPGTPLRYKSIKRLDNPRICSLHIRRFERYTRDQRVRYDNKLNREALTKLGKKMTANFKARIIGTDFEALDQAPWALEARETTRNLEQCRREAFGVRLDDRNQICQQSSAGCADMLTTQSEFLKTELTWTNVAHTAFFNNYIER